MLKNISQDSKDNILLPFLFPPIVRVATMGPIKRTQPKKFWNFQNRTFRKILFKKQQDSFKQVYKEFKILKFHDLLYL